MQGSNKQNSDAADQQIHVEGSAALTASLAASQQEHTLSTSPGTSQQQQLQQQEQSSGTTSSSNGTSISTAGALPGLADHAAADEQAYRSNVVDVDDIYIPPAADAYLPTGRVKIEHDRLHTAMLAAASSRSHPLTYRQAEAGEATSSSSSIGDATGQPGGSDKQLQQQQPQQRQQPPSNELPIDDIDFKDFATPLLSEEELGECAGDFG